MPSYFASGTTVGFSVVSVCMWAAIVVSYYFCLVFDQDLAKLNPARWAGLLHNSIWWPWVGLMALVVVAYFAFFFLFLMDDDQAAANSMHSNVFYVSVGFYWSGAMWPYLVRRVELGGKHMVSGFLECKMGVAGWLELILAFPLSIVLWKVESWHVLLLTLITALCSLAMLVLFCFGASASGFSSVEVGLVCALVYIVLYLFFVDTLFWGYSWFNKLEARLHYWCYIEFYNPSSDKSLKGDLDLLWSDTALLERVPFLSATPPALSVERVFMQSNLA